jgi:vacuolar-type H+-ATPase subunit H
LNDKRIEQILEIEKQAQAIYDQAVNEAEQLPVQAEKEAQALIEKARQDAEEEARQIISKAKCEEECAQILAEAEKKVKRTETLAASNFDHAVSYVLNRVIGRE